MTSSERQDSRLELLRADPERPSVSVIITTFNEEVNIADCIRSVMWADEILLVDSFSTDRTLELAEKFPIEILQREYFGSAAQKNWAMDRVRSDWILILDADERVPEVLAEEILRLLIRAPGHNGYYLRRRNIMFDKVVQHSGWSTDKVIRLFDRRHGRYPNRRVHADLAVEGATPTLENHLVHYTYRSIEQYFKKFMNYAEWGAAQGFRDGRRAGFKEIALRPAWRFFRTYVIQQGFRDGLHGLVVCGLQAFNVFVKYAWLWEYHERSRLGEEIEFPAFDDSEETWARPDGDRGAAG